MPDTAAKTVAPNHSLNTGGLLSTISGDHVELQAVIGSHLPARGWKRFRPVYTLCPHGQSDSATTPQHRFFRLCSDAAVRSIENIQNCGREGDTLR